MKTLSWFRGCVAGSLLLTTLVLAEARPLRPADLAPHGLSAGAAEEVLPRGAVLHARFNGLLPVIEGLEGILKAAVPLQALPPDAQGVMQTPHPILFLAGLKAFGAPLEEAQLAGYTGLALREAATISLYLGDPRRMVIVSLPLANPEALAGLLNGLLQPTEVEPLTLGSGSAVRIVSSKPGFPELYLLCSGSRAYLCADRALAVALHALPPDERLARDGFIARSLAGAAGQHVAVVGDPRMLKPLVMQLQQLQPVGLALFRQHRGEFLKQIPPQQRQQLEAQFQAQFGVENLDQFADYLEAILDVTSRQLLDALTNRWLAFEGLCLTARLDAAFPELGLRIYSQQFQPTNAPAAIPLDEVLKALRWVGSDFSRLAVTGRTPPAGTNSGLKHWTAAIRAEFTRKGLRSSWFERFESLLAETREPATVESQAPWTLTVQAPVEPVPSPATASSLTAYLQSLQHTGSRAVRIVPGADVAFLERLLTGETAILNRNREVVVDFNRQTVQQEPWFHHVNRLQTLPPEQGVHQFILESAWQTQGGLFGYDQHEWINRRWFLARNLDGYLAYHQGGRPTDWLRQLDPARTQDVIPAVSRLVGQLPAGVNDFTVQRSLQYVPAFVDWVAALEERIHADLQNYVTRAREAAAGETNPVELRSRLARLPMPELLYSLNQRPGSGELYAVLPGNLAFPRARVLPFVQRVLAGYTSAAREVGGSLVYTRVEPGVWQLGLVQNTEAFTRLVSTVGNAIAVEYLQSPANLQTLQGALRSPQDGRSETFDEILVANPRWYFIPRPAPKTDAARAEVPPRSPEAPASTVDLTPHYNGRLDRAWQTGGMRDNHLGNLPAGLREFGGVTFDVRGVVQLSGQDAVEQLTVRFPKVVTGIAVHRRAARLHFLHAAAWPAAPGTVIGHYVIVLADGRQLEVPITYGRDVRDWWTQEGEAAGEARVVWSGPNQANPNGPPKQLYLTTWENPAPDAAVASVTCRSTMASSAPFLVALSTE